MGHFAFISVFAANIAKTCFCPNEVEMQRRAANSKNNFFIIVNLYFVAASRRFIITNIKRAEITQSTINTPHTIHSGNPPQR